MSKFLGWKMHDLLREIGVLPEGVYTEDVTVEARRGERCQVRYATARATVGGRAYDQHEADLEWKPLLQALIATGVLGHPTYCRAFTIRAPHDKPCTITYEYFCDDGPLFAGLRAARLAEHVGEALVR